MRNLLLAFTTGFIGGNLFAVYHERQLRHINRLESRLSDLIASQPLTSPALHSPELPTVRGGEYRH